MLQVSLAMVQAIVLLFQILRLLFQAKETPCPFALFALNSLRDRRN